MSVQARSYVQLIMGAVSLWTRPSGPVPEYRALKKKPPQLMSCPQRVSPTGATVEAQLSSPRRHLWNSHHLHNRDIDHRVHRPTAESPWSTRPMGISLCVATRRMTTCGTRTTCITGDLDHLFSRATGESQWSDEQSAPW